MSHGSGNVGGGGGSGSGGSVGGSGSGSGTAGLRLTDHHVHGVVTEELDAAGVEFLLSESSAPPPPGTSFFDSALGFVVRRWCAPVLDLEPLAPAPVYLRRRLELGSTEVSRRLLTAAAMGLWLVDTGYQSDAVATPAELAELSGSPAREVVRLESIAERVARAGGSAAHFSADVEAAVQQAVADGAVGFKSIAAYRGGLSFDPARPGPAEVLAAADRWYAAAGSGARVEDQVLIRQLIWTALDAGLPVQLHTGYGDTDSRLHRSDPALLHDFLLASQPTGTPVMLLHCYPYHRQAGALAALFPHVYMDVGVALNHVGARSAVILAEALELTPFHKMLYSSDAFGLPELHYLGAIGFRRDIERVTGGYVASGDWSAADAARVAELIGSGNADRVYRLDER